VTPGSVPPVATIRIDADLEHLAAVRRLVREGAEASGADARAVDDLIQVVDEWVTNVIVHGYRGADGPVDVTVERIEDEVVVRVRDLAPVFDPASAPPFDPSVPLEHRRFGGMGIFLMRELTDRLEHRAVEGGGNELTMRRALGAPSREDRRGHDS
jgi:serine/threonine-protein kinase RsbW